MARESVGISGFIGMSWPLAGLGVAFLREKQEPPKGSGMQFPCLRGSTPVRDTVHNERRIRMAECYN